MEMEQKGRIGDDGKKVAKSLDFGVLALRVLALVLTVAATLVMGTAKETEIVPLKLLPGLPVLNVPAPAKWSYMSALVYFVVANAMACLYAALALVLTVANSRITGKKGMITLLILTFDVLMVAILASGCGAATAVGILGYKGNSHVQWKKVCNIFGKFCHQIGASILLSLLGTLALILVIVLTALKP